MTITIYNTITQTIMKTSKNVFLFILLVSGFTFSCKKDDPNAGFSDEIKNIVPSEVIAAIRKQGMKIYEGKTPPKIEGVYLFSDNVLSASSIEDDEIGDIYADYRYQFYEQDQTSLAVKTSFRGYNSKGKVISEGLGKGSFISGKDNVFSVFSEEHVTSSTGATSVILTIYSGEYTDTGIKNFQYAFYMKDKNDPNNDLIDVGATRVFKDGDGLSEFMTNLRMNGEAIVKKESAMKENAGR